MGRYGPCMLFSDTYMLIMKRFAILAAGIAATALPGMSVDRKTHNPNATNTQSILHAWSWSFPEIASNMKAIKDAGFTMVQTSPVQNCYAPEGSGKKIFDENVVEGNWYYYYQPTDWKIGNHILGSKQQMAAMMDSAARYGVDIIVDVLPNHTAFDIDAVSDDFYKAVGGRDKCFIHRDSIRCAITTTVLSAHSGAQEHCRMSTQRLLFFRNTIWNLSTNCLPWAYADSVMTLQNI